MRFIRNDEKIQITERDPKPSCGSRLRAAAATAPRSASRGGAEGKADAGCSRGSSAPSLCHRRSVFSSSSAFHPTFRVPEILHRTAGLHPVRRGVRGPAHHDHLAEGRPAHPSEPGGDHRQHRLHELLAHLQPVPHAQRELHLHSPERGRGRGAPEPADRER